ncbi:DUF6171 family protein [Cohnella massiliensis]|uniref:DUF6171 family protein n=1 Tax=Cohnella massiliensis TaxID=1816691 RepID=UPI001FECE503|nr:DUF6171 family protein [Cohnella massiliensis]
MAHRRDGCKGCADSVRVSPDKLERLIAVALQGREAAAEAEAARRLAACRACSGLQYGTTCRYCGCLVDVRARLRGSACPHPGASRWRSEEGGRTDAGRRAEAGDGDG